jgi:Na+/H+-dicarboxylate symporter
LTEWPNGLIAAVVLFGVAGVLFLIGLTLQLLPDDAIEVFDWAPLGSYKIEDFYGAIVPLMFAGAVCAAVALGRGRSLGRGQRVLAGLLFTAGVAAALVVVVTLALIVLLCSSGKCS